MYVLWYGSAICTQLTRHLNMQCFFSFETLTNFEGTRLGGGGLIDQQWVKSHGKMYKKKANKSKKWQ